MTVPQGFFDQHIHGFAGTDFATSSVADILDCLKALRNRNTTEVIASLPTLPLEMMEASVRRLAIAGEQDPTIRGIHLEGPFLSPGACGAHPIEDVLADDTPARKTYLQTILNLQNELGIIRRITVAPEIPGFCEIVANLTGAGIEVSPGHTQADAQIMDQTLRFLSSLNTQPTVVTHLFNAMAPFHHRSPGALAPILAAAHRKEIIVELIADGHHLDGETIRMCFELFPHAIRIVSDASAATYPSDTAPFDTQHRLGTAHLQPGTKEIAPTVLGTNILASGSCDLMGARDYLHSIAIAPQNINNALQR